MNEKRKEGWERRLDDVIEATRHRPYVLGKSDCFRFACEVMQALLGGESRWVEWEGKYETRADCDKIVDEHGGPVRWDQFFGSRAMTIKHARRGDICMYRDEHSDTHFAVCLGTYAAAYAAKGLVFTPMTECRWCWPIG